MDDWKFKVDNFLKQNKINFDNKSVLVAVSGGCDSMLLLNYCVYLLNKSAVRDVGVAHLNHCLRFEAERDEEFVRATCNGLSLKFYSKKVDILNKSKLDKVSVEEAGHHARYEFFEEILSEHGYDFVLTAHHKNDLAESFIINAIKGAGLKGLAGINIVDRKSVRPFLCMDKSEILEQIDKEKIRFVEDHTNHQNDYFRNYIRNVVIKAIEKVEPSAVKNIAKSAFTAKNLDEYMNSTLAAKVEKDFWGKDYVPIEVLSQNPSVLYYQLKDIFLNWGLKSTRKSLWETFSLMLGSKNRGKIDLDSGFKVCLDCDGIRFFEGYEKFNAIKLDFKENEGCFWVFDKKIEYRLTFCSDNNYFLELWHKETSQTEKLKLEKDNFPYAIAPRVCGMRDVSGKKIKEVFVKLAIPWIYKDNWPLLTNKDGRVENIIFYQRWKNYGRWRQQKTGI